jgi:sugar O-acyltransferase (sialic acid O-acetyltransferase NeuD family)
MATVVIFGTSDFASLAHFYLRHDSSHRVVGFTVDRDYMPTPATFEGLPVVPFDELSDRFPPTMHAAFAPLSHRRMNALREGVYHRLKAAGYELISYVSSRATRFPGTPIGDNCFILEDNTLQPFSSVGSNVVMWSGNHLGHHSRIDDHAFVTSHVVISGHCRIGRNAFIGVNATLRDGITIGERTFVAMGSVVAQTIPPDAVVKGHPGRVTGVPSAQLED